MIERQQIAAALGRLDPRDREVLDYSLRRRVPDEDLGEIFGGTPGEVARLRAAAVEKLSTDLGVQRGSDLGHMLKELLDPATWQLVPPASGERPPASAEEPRRERGHDPVGVVPAQPEPAAIDPEPEHPPVLDMLAGRDTDAVEERGRGRRDVGRRLVVGLSAVVALLVPAGVVAALIPDDPDGTRGESSGASSAETFQPQPEAIGDPFPTDPKSAYRYPVARVKETTALYDKPNGEVRVRVAPTTEWDSDRVMSVVRRRGPWLAVLVPELPNGEVGWVRDDRVERLDTVSLSLHADLSRRVLLARRDGKTIRRMRIGVGRSDHPTPPGRFAVTDKLRVNDASSPYGCCVLALTGHQTKLPAGWPGGDRLAVHATSDLSGLGQAVSLGCLRTHPKDARWMLDAVRLGTPVFIRS